MFLYLMLASLPVILFPVFNTTYKASVNSNDKFKRNLLIFCGIALFLMVALRSKYVGSADSYNYYTNWVKMSHITWNGLDSALENSEMEKGYLFTVWCFSRIFKNAQFLFVLTGILFSISVCRFIYINSKDVVMSFVMYVCLGAYWFMVQGLRQAIAMSICLFGIEFCKKRKIIPFVLLIILATQYHRTAIVFIFVYFLYGITLNTVTYIIAFLCSGMLFVFASPIVTIANRIFGSEYSSTVDSGGFVATAVYLLIIFVAILYQKNLKGKDPNFSLFFFLTLAGAVFFIMRYVGVLAAGRISYYFMFGQIILLPNVVQTLERRSRVTLKIIILLLNVLLLAYRLSTSDLIPYRFFWQ